MVKIARKDSKIKKSLKHKTLNTKYTQITLVRHGKSFEYTKDQPKYPGPGLTEYGMIQAKKTGKYLAQFKFDKIYCSDMTRAMQTAKEIKKYQKCKIAHHRELAEFNRIVFDSKREKTDDKDKLKTNIRRAKSTIKMFKNIIHAENGKKILIVAHGNVIKSILACAVGIDLRKTPNFNIFNCSISTLFFKNNKLSAVYNINYISHYADVLYTNEFIDKNRYI